jgi:hypothetical protein
MVAVTFLFLGVCVISANAQLTVKQYQEFVKSASTLPESDNGRQLPELYIKGIGEGLSWANTYLAVKHQELLFCAPEKLGLDAKNYQQLLETFLPVARKMKLAISTPVDEMSVANLLAFALIDAFPCNKGAKQ